MNFKAIIVITLCISLCITIVSSQDVGQGIDGIIKSIDENTKQYKATDKKIEDLYGRLNDMLHDWAVTIITGVSLFSLIIIFSREFIERIRILRKKRSLLEYISQLEERERKLVEKNLKTVEDIESKISIMNTNLTELNTILLSTPKYVKPTKMTYILPFIMGIILTLMVHSLGVF